MVQRTTVAALRKRRSRATSFLAVAAFLILISAELAAFPPAVHASQQGNQGGRGNPDMAAATYADGACASPKSAFLQGEAVHGGVSGTGYPDVLFVYFNIGTWTWSQTSEIPVINGSACDAAGYAPSLSQGKWFLLVIGCDNGCYYPTPLASFTVDHGRATEATFSDSSCEDPALSFNEGSTVYVGGVIRGPGRGWNVNVLYPSSHGGTAASFYIQNPGPYCVGYTLLPTDPAGVWSATLTNSSQAVQTADPSFIVVQPLPDLPVGVLPIALAAPMFYFILKRRAVAHS